MKVKLHWNGHLERWVMRDMLGNNVFEFPDCLNFNLKYPGLDKGKVNVVEDPRAQVISSYDREQDGL